MCVVYVVEFISKKQQQMSTRARAEKVSISLSFSLSSKTIVVVVFAFVGESVAHDKSEKKKEKTVVSQSVVWFCFSLPKQTRKRPKKKIKILPLLNTPLLLCE